MTVSDDIVLTVKDDGRWKGSRSVDTGLIRVHGWREAGMSKPHAVESNVRNFCVLH